MKFAVKCIPTYTLEYRGRRKVLPHREGLIAAKLMSAKRWVLTVTLMTIVSDDERENRILGFGTVPEVVDRLNALLEGWPLRVESKNGQYRMMGE